MYGRLFAADRTDPSPRPPWTRLRYIARGFLPADCQAYDLERWSLDHYVSALAREVKLRHIQRRYHVCLHDKYLFQLMMQALTDRIAPAFGAITRASTIRLGDDEATADPRAWLRGLLAAHGKVVVKPVTGHGGGGVRILTKAEDVASVPVGEVDLLVTRFVEQDAYARAIYAGSTNTLRLLMMRDEHGVFLAMATHRFGTSASAPLDSVGRGGMGARIDPASGSLESAAQHPRFSGGSLVWHDHHPETGAAIRGARIPGWHRMLAEVSALTERLSFLTYVGWDVAMTPGGFAIIEGNHNSDVSGMQMHGPLLVDDRVAAFFRRHGIRSPEPCRPRRPGGYRPA